MAFAVGASLYFSAGTGQTDIKKLDALIQKTSDFQMRVLLAQAIIKPENTDDKLHLEQLEFLFQTMEESPVSGGDNLSAQKFILMRHLGKDAPVPEDIPANIKKEFTLLYLENQQLNKNEAEIFKIPFGELALLRQYSLEGSQKEHDELLSRLKKESENLVIKMQSIFAAVSLMFGAGVFILFSFLRRKKISLFAPIIEMIPAGNHRLLLETVIIHLFLMFPVAAYIFMTVPGLDSILFNSIYIPVSFSISLFYYYKNAEPNGYLSELILGISRTGILREILFGVIGFLAIFPVAMVSLLFGVGVFDGPDVRFAHPITYAIKDHPGIIFFLAVVVAPITEEIIFRSFLYGFFRKYLRIHHSVILTGFIFAILHPQGITAIFYLMVIGGGLAVLREFRNGLIAPITTHVMINSIATLVAYQFWAN